MTERSFSDREIGEFDKEAIAAAVRETVALADRYGAKVVSATKTVPVEIINFAFANGLRYMGENKVQELMDKYDRLDAKPGMIHFIGQLQTNKVKYIVGKVSLIHSLDSLKLAKEISARSKAKGIVTDCLCEINIADEDGKGGIAKDDAEAFITEASKLDGIRIVGLMSIGPHLEKESDYVPFFTEISGLFKDLSAKGLLGSKPELSLGMSDNYRLALEYGATIIRPGTALFGRRKYPVK